METKYGFGFVSGILLAFFFFFWKVSCLFRIGYQVMCCFNIMISLEIYYFLSKQAKGDFLSV